MYKSSDYYGEKLAEIWYPMSKAWEGKKDASEWLDCFIDSIDHPEKYEEDYASTKGVFNKNIKRWYEDKPELLKRLKEFEEEFSKETLMYCSPDTNQLWKAQIEQGFHYFEGMEKIDPDYEKISGIVKTFYEKLIGKKLSKKFYKSDSEENIARQKEIDELLEKLTKLNGQ